MSNTLTPLHPPLRPNDDRTPDTYRTDNLELASYLLARGHRLIGADPSAPLVAFVFEPGAVGDVANFFSGTTPPGTTPIPPVKLFEHHRTLRSMIATMRSASSPRRRRMGCVA
jgi:hypothetical protein